MPESNEKFIIVTTVNRGVFAGYASEQAIEASDESKRIILRHAKMAIRFGTEKGIAQLAHTGPTEASRIGAPATIRLQNITAVFSVEPAAQAAWETR